MAKINFSGGGKGASSPLRRRLIGVLTVLLILGVGGAMTYAMFWTYVRPYETSIKESRYGSGLDPEARTGPSLYFTGPGVTYHRFPTTVQSLTMSSPMGDRDPIHHPDHRGVGPLEIDSSDGSKIRIDATVLYRIKDPFAVLTKAGQGRLFEDNVIIPKAQQALKEALGRLKAEDFYSESLRVEATLAAKKRLNETVDEFGLVVDHVLVRQYYYEDKYQKQIEERKKQDQLVFTNESAAEAAKMEALRRKLEAEGKASYDLELRRGDAEVKKLRAEADLYSRKRRAEADLLVSLAEAEGTELENAAYRSSRGSDNLVGLEMAEALDGIEVIFVQGGPGGVNFLDLNSTLDMFDVGGN